MSNNALCPAELPVPTTERELNQLLDDLFEKAKTDFGSDEIPWKQKGFTKLLEYMVSEPVIMRALEKLKHNDGSMTPGVDDTTIRDFLTKSEKELLEYVRHSFEDYHPQEVRRVWIPKPGKTDKRPLGIPTVGDRIIQECVRTIIEPILEAQFSEHSYGFRPMRDCKHAYVKVTDTIWKTGNFWVVEGDISKFFDNVNHNILMKKLYSMGIKDKRVLMIVKMMLKAGIMGECKRNDMGTPQGGIISPLLANVYLDSLDKWVTREWEHKKLRKPWKPRIRKSKTGEEKVDTSSIHFQQLRGATNLKPAHFVRYADDWVLITDTKENAEKWKWRISHYCKRRLKINLSSEKTLITNVSRRAMKFLGFEIKFVKKYNTKLLKAKKQTVGTHGYVVYSKPDQERLRAKMALLREQIYLIRKERTLLKAMHRINVVNSIITGLHNYYNVCTHVNIVFAKWAWWMNIVSYNSLKTFGGRSRKVLKVPANTTDNLVAKHQNLDAPESERKPYRRKVVALRVNGLVIGITDLSFVRCTIKTKGDLIKALKKQDETPYSAEGRLIYKARTGKRPMAEREDEILSNDLSYRIAVSSASNDKIKRFYNVEYLINRARALNMSRMKCKCCKALIGYEIRYFHVHHVRKSLPIHLVNKTENLIPVCIGCHEGIHHAYRGFEVTRARWFHIGKKEWKLIEHYHSLLDDPGDNQKSKSKKKSSKKVAAA